MTTPVRTDAKRSAKFAIGRVSPNVYARLLLAVGLGFFVLTKLRTWSDPWTLDDPLGPISALEVIEATVLFSLCGRLKRAAASFSIEEACITVLALSIIAVIGGPKLAFGCASVVFAARFWAVPGARAAVSGLLILCAQLAASAGPLFALHRGFGALDAFVVRGLTHVGGYATTGTGSIVAAPRGVFAVDVNAGCASSYVALGVIAGFALIVLWRRGRFSRTDALWGAGLIVLVTLLNWARIVPMVFSREAHHFWHDAMGAQLVAFLDGALTCGLALLATRVLPGSRTKRAADNL